MGLSLGEGDRKMSRLAETKSVSVIVPVYNNASTLEALCSALACSLTDYDYDVLLVNDGSRDESLATLKRLAAADDRLKVISLSRNFGQHPAIAAGLEHATGDVVVLMDADLEDKPEHIPALLHALEVNECDIVYTTKEKGDRASRDLTSNLYHLVFSRLVGISLPRQLGTFRVFTRKVRDALNQFCERHAVYGPLMFYAGFRYVIVPVDCGTRPEKSSYSFGKRLRLALNSLVTYSDLPPIVFAVMGVLLVVLPLLYGLAVVLQYFIVGRSLPQGLTVIVLLMCVLTGSLMLAIGVLGVYVFRIFQEVLGRPRYLIDETVNVTGVVTDGCSRR